MKTPYFKSTRQTSGDKIYPVHLIAQNRAGFKNLLKIVSSAHLDASGGDDPHQDLDDLEGKTEGLILMTGGAEGPLGALIKDGRTAEAEALLETLKGLFPGRLYIEIQRHGMDIEKKTEEGFLELAYGMDLPLVATNNANFINEDMYRAHDALLCIAAGTYVAETERRHLTPEHRLKTADEMCTLFDDLPEALENTVHISKRSAYAPEGHDPILPNFRSAEALSEADLLKKDAEKGLEGLLDNQVYQKAENEEAREATAKPYRERLAFELNVITKMGFPGYFLIVADFIQWAKDHNIPVGPGRGSGAGSVVAWALGITDLDPLRFGLLFERFLNPERVSMPDFDIDFCQEKRDQVIHYVQEKYGYNNVAQIITFGSMNARGVLRDVGRVLQQPYPVTDRLSKMIPNNPAAPTTLGEALKIEPRLKHEYQNDELTKEVINRALKLEGLFRHASTHAAGVVIGDRPLQEIIPLYRDPRSTMPVTGYSMKWAEKAGLVKFDFLGLKTLTVLQKTIEFIKASGTEVDLGALPLNDTKSYELIARGDTAGVFQLEGSGMRQSLRALKPDKFEDIIAMVALYRPGPMDNIPSYINRKHGTEEVDCLHEWLEPVLEETHGVIIYQEQVMEIAKVLAQNDELTKEVINRALKLEGLFRHASTHAAGVVIGDRPLQEIIPLYRDPRSTMPVTGYSMKWAEKAGLVKFDFLGLKTLTVLQKTIEFIKASGTEVDLGALPLNDTKSYELIARGDTAGVFQLEGSGMRQSLRALKPDKFEDIIAMVALYRPGPMDNIPSYINRKHGTEEVDCLHEWLEPVLEETHGVIIYQEQVMEIAKVLAGYSLGEADLLRRAMGKKIQSEMDAQRKRFIDGAKEKGVPEPKASHIFDLVNKFAGYGFNKSHAAAYALIAYQTAYFKANFPVEFMAATLSLERDNTDKLNMLVREVRAMKIPLYPPDINASNANFSVEGEAEAKGIRYALAAVKNVGAKAMESIVHERLENGPFKNIHEVMERIEITSVNKRQMENLAYAGAFDSLNPNRAQNLGALDMLLKHAHACHEARISNQVHLFASDEESPVPRIPLPEIEEWEPAQILKNERNAIGFFFTSHPLETYSEILAKRGVRQSVELLTNPSLSGQKTVKMAGIVEDLQERKAAKSGKMFAFLAMSDAAGTFEALVFGDTLTEIRGAIEEDLPLLLDVSVDKSDSDDTPRLIVRDFELFDPERLARNAELMVSVEGEEALDAIKGVLEKHKGGRGIVTLSILAQDEEREVQIRLSEPFKVTPALQGAIKSFPGVTDARVTYK